MVRDIVASGDASVLFVSHDLDEVLEVTDRVTVLRDGNLQGTVDTTTTTESQLVEMIIGRRFESLALAPQQLAGTEVRRRGHAGSPAGRSRTSTSTSRAARSSASPA